MVLRSPAAVHAQEPPAAGPAGREVVTRSELEAAGVMRLGEVARLVAGWNAATVDDFTWRMSPRGLPSAIEDRWLLLVDGRPVEAGVLGVTSLERLPLDLQSIDSIEFVSVPAVASGRIARHGLVHIHTERPREGVSARGRLAFGSETGDPGPFAFLPDGQLNRDRYGQEAAGEVAYADERWFAAGSLTGSVHFPTDPLILDRIYATSPIAPRIERFTSAIRLGVHGPAGGHRLVAGTSRLDDWTRLEPAGIEVPVRSALAHASAAGTVALAGAQLRYRAGYDRTHVDSRPGALAPPLNGVWRTIQAAVELAPGWNSGTRGVEIAGGFTVVDRTRPGFDGETGIGGHARGAWRLTPALRQEAALLLSGRGTGVEGGVIVAHELMTGAGRFSFRVAGSRGRAMSDGGLLELAARGDPWLGASGIALELPPADVVSREGAVDLEWTRDGAKGAVSAAVYLRVFDGVLTMRRELAWDTLRLAWRGPLTVAPASGRLAGGRVRGEYDFSANVRGSVAYSLAAPFGDRDFRDAEAAIPRHRALVSADWRPVAGFGMRGALEVESARRWPDYDRTAPAAGKSRSVVPARATASAAAWKTFMDGRLSARIVARNLTGERVILHPEGSASGLAFFVLLGGTL